MKKTFFILTMSFILISCGNNSNTNNESERLSQTETVSKQETNNDNSELARRRQEENYRKLHEQPTKKYSKPNDFMVAVLNNPTFNLFDFITVLQLNSGNTQFLSENEYAQSNFIHNAIEKRYGRYDAETFHLVYGRVSNAWRVYNEVENTDCSFDGMGQYFFQYSEFDSRRYSAQQCPYPELKRKLSIIPLENN